LPHARLVDKILKVACKVQLKAQVTALPDSIKKKMLFSLCKRLCFECP
jgi:hypothetical protein